MSKPILAAAFRVGAPSASYDIERVTSDPRVAGLVRDLGSVVEVIGAQGAFPLVKYASWNTAWRPPEEGPFYPNTQALFQAATKLANAKTFNLDQLLGNVVSLEGTQTLVAQGTPTFQRTVGDKVGIFYDAASDSHEADLNAVGSNSFAWGAIVADITNPAAVGGPGFLGRYITATDIGYLLFMNAATGIATIRISDGAAPIQQAIGAVDLRTLPVRLVFLQGQVDRLAGRVRARASQAGVGVIGNVDVAIGATGSLTGGAAQRFGFGSIPTAAPGVDGGACISYGYVCIDVTAEGANALRDAAVGLGFEV